MAKAKKILCTINIMLRIKSSGKKSILESVGTIEELLK